MKKSHLIFLVLLVAFPMLILSQTPEHTNRKEIIGKWVLVDTKNQEYKKSDVEYFIVNADSTATIYTEQYGERTGNWYWKIAKNAKIKSMSFDVEVDVYISVMQTENRSHGLMLTLKEKEGQLILSAGNSIYKKE